VIVVTGGLGFIGRHVCSALAARGHDVVAVDTRGADADDTKCPCATVACDICHQDEVDQVLRDYPVTTLIHLASMLNTASVRSPSDATQVNVLGSLHLLEAARRHHVTRFLYGSSISVYGTQDTSAVADHELLSRPPAPENLYGMSKRYVEMLGAAYQQQFGGQFVALRIAAVIGAGARSSTSRWRSEVFERLGDPHAAVIAIPHPGEAQLPLVHVGDVAAMFIRLAEAAHLSRPVYNTPAETWAMQTLGDYIESLAPHIRVTYGRSATGNPTTITGRAFMTEIGYTPEMSLRERFQEACF
jgi:UDP-glucose 4-epimerase